MLELLQLLLAITIAGLLGALAELPTGFSTGGVVVAIVIGIGGTYLGMAVAYLFTPPLFFLPVMTGPYIIDLVWGFIGSLLLVLLIELLRRLIPSRTTESRGDPPH